MYKYNRQKQILCITPLKYLKDAYTQLEQFGTIDYKPEIKKEDFCYLEMDKYDIIFCNPNKQNYLLDKEVLGNFKGTILTASTGLNHIDVEYCKSVGITVLCHKNDMKLLRKLPSTAELAFGLMLSIIRNIPSSFEDVKVGGWEYDAFMGHQLKDKQVGIIGFGRLGQMMTKYCWAFDAKTNIYDPYSEKAIMVGGLSDLDDVLERSDILSLHVHPTEETKYMINKKTLGKMKKGSYIVNTSRGEIVNEEDIVQSLRDGHLKGYATDVLEDEYGNRHNSPILKGVKEGLNIIVTPHMGGSTWEGQEKAFKWSIKKLRDVR